LRACIPAGAPVCVRCGRDVAAEPIKYEAGDGRILCEHCFRVEGELPPGEQAPFTALRVLGRLLKVLAFLGLAGGLMMAYLSRGSDLVVDTVTAVNGVLIFLTCVILSELIRLGLSIHAGVQRMNRAAERLVRAARERENGAGSRGDTGAGVEPW
jgi:hypothetical protein